MDKSSNQVDRKHSRRDGNIQHFRQPEPPKRKLFTESTQVQQKIDQNARIPRVTLKRLNPDDLLSYMNAAVTTVPIPTESKCNDTITSQCSESDDWHLCVSTTSEEDFQASPIYRNANVLKKVTSAQSQSLPITKATP